MISIILIIGFLRTVVVILIIFYAVRLITRFVLPLLFQKTIKDMQAKMHQQMRDQQRQEKREGEVTVERNQNQNNRNSQTGEYVDFEEVD
jgi:predicted Holliday junction resolvase-like endonuclease